MKYIDFITDNHKKTKRNYLERVVQDDKAEAAKIAIKYGKEYWDGDRKYGYGGYKYDGRWLPIAEKIAKYYDLKQTDKVLDVGCGKGFLLYELTKVVTGITVAGIDISEYAINNAKEEIKPFIKLGNAIDLPFDDKTFDFVISITTLHNLFNYDLDKALKEIERVGKDKKYVVVESYRNEHEKVNMLYWQLTCRAFHTPQEWEWIFNQSGYKGDYGFIFFE